MHMTTVADNLIASLVAGGVTHVYGVPGDSLNGITDAMRRSGELTWAQVRHEESAAFAAGAEAELTGRLSVCIGSCGPGNLHLINGLYDANRSRVPVLAIAAHIPSEEMGSTYFQETHPQDLFRECSVYCELVTRPDQMPRLLRIAMQTAVAKRGVAVLVISSELPEVIGISDRILVMREGVIVGEVGGSSGKAATQENIMALATGTTEMVQS